MALLFGVRAGAVVCAGAVLAVACGSKSGLLDARVGVSPDGGVGGSSGFGGSGGSGAFGGAGGSGGDAPPPPPCRLQIAGEPHQVLAFQEGEAGDADLALIEGGTPDRPAHVALLANSEEANFWHPELRVAELAVGASWPDVTTTQAPVLWGFDAHAGGLMSEASGGPGLALAFYHADEASPTVVPGFKFRPFDVEKWSPGAELFVDPAGAGGYALAPGPSVDAAGTYAGHGYAVVYRAGFDDGTWEPRVAIVDSSGKIALEPIALAPPGEYPGAGAGIAWTGTDYVAAVAEENAIGILRVVPGTQSAEHTGTVPYLLSGSVARRPWVASHAGHTWVLWREAQDAETIESWVVRAVRLTPDGALGASVIELAAAARPVNGVTLHVSSAGVTAAWAEVSPETPPPTSPGHSHLIFHQLDFDGVPVQEPIELAVTQLAYDPPQALVTLDYPRGVLSAWCGEPVGVDAPSVVYVARFDCIE